jgi:hypothetical protein
MQIKKYLEPIAVFLICLVVSLPIYISSAYASINSVNAYGAEGVENYVSSNYDLTVEATASLTNTTITPDFLRLTEMSTGYQTNFDSCSATSNGSSTSTCTVNVQNSDSSLNLCPSTEYKVELLGASGGSAVDSENFDVYCDIRAPTVTASLSSLSTTGGDITLSYSVVDPTDSTTKCTRISKVEIYLDSLGSGAATIIPNSTSCSYSRSTTVSTSGYTEGNHTIFVMGYDLMEQSSVANVTFRVDNSGPTASGGAVITDSSGNTISYFTPQYALVDIIVNITDPSGVSSYSFNSSGLGLYSPTCTTITNGYQCRWDNQNIYFGNASITRTVQLSATDGLGNENSQTLSIAASLPQDTTSPTVTVSSPSVSTNDGSTMTWYRPTNMKAVFGVTITDDISGIKNISGDFSNLNVISGGTPSCSGSTVGTYTCNWTRLVFYMDSSSYSKQFSITVFDRAGNSQTATQTITAPSYLVDSSGPSVTSFDIVNSSSGNITYWIDGDSFSVDATAYVSEQGSGILSVYGDFSDLNPSYTTRKQATCTQTSSSGTTTSSTSTSSGIYSFVSSANSSSNASLPSYTYTCTWDLTADFNQSGNPLTATIDINATDNSLNSVITSFSKTFQVDVDGPTVSSLESIWYYNSTYYVGVDSNQFIASLSDSGVGFPNNTKYSYMDLSGIGFASSTLASNCSIEGMCYWNILGCESVDEGLHTVSITTSTRDALGNTLSTPYYLNVTLHMERPSVNSINVSPVAAITDLFEPYIQTGNALYIVANVTEQLSLLSATADLSKFILNETSLLADSCTQQTNSQGNLTSYWICIWSTDEIDINYYKKDYIYLNFTDVAGNTYRKEHQIEVFQAMNDTYNYWTHSVGTSSPAAIDKQIVTFYNPSVLTQIYLSSNDNRAASDLWPLDIIVDSCSSNITDGNGTPTVNYLASSSNNRPGLVNFNTDTPTQLPYLFYLNYLLENSAPSGNNLTIPCTVKIKSLVDGTKITPYESENITVVINYYNNPLGTLDANIQEEIEDVQDGWLVGAEWLGTIEQIFGWLKAICGIIQNIVGITKVWSAATTALGSNKYTEAASIVTGKTTDYLDTLSKSSWGSFANKFCKAMNCQLFYGKDWGGKDPGLTGVSATNMFADYGRWRSRWSQYWTPQNSLVLSILAFCLPGISYNLQKARVIDCQYILCLKSTRYGVPLQICVKQRDYAWCNYVFGEVLNLIPFAGMASAWLQKIKMALTQPAEAIGIVLKAACRATCTTAGTTVGCSPCIIIEGLNLVLDLLCDFGVDSGNGQCEPFWETLKVNDEICKDALSDD